MGSPGISLVTVKPSGGGIFRGNDKLAEDDKALFHGLYVNGIASQYSHVGLFNPAGSGITVLIDEIWAHATGDTSIYLRTITALLGNDNGVWTARNISGANGLAHITSENNVAFQGVSKVKLEVLQSQLNVFPFKIPWKLAEGRGLLVASYTVARALDVWFHGREV